MELSGKQTQRPFVTISGQSTKLSSCERHLTRGGKRKTVGSPWPYSPAIVLESPLYDKQVSSERSIRKVGPPKNDFLLLNFSRNNGAADRGKQRNQAEQSERRKTSFIRENFNLRPRTEWLIKNKETQEPARERNAMDKARNQEQRYRRVLCSLGQKSVRL